MTARLVIAAVALSAAAPVAARPANAGYVYCSVPSTSPRGLGLILTTIFQSRSDIAFVESAFVNYLRASYAPYGNGWIFSERDVACVSFIKRRQAEIERGLDISRVPRPAQTVFNVTFQIG